MKEIVDIKILRNNNAFIKFNNSEFYKFHIDIINKFSIKIGNKFSDEEFNKIILENQKIQAIKYSLSLISKKQRSEFEIIKKLKLKNYDINLIKDVIIKLKENNFINDVTFAENLCDYYINSKGYGISRIKKELKLKGVNNEIISKVIDNFKEDKLNIDLIKKQLEKKLKLLSKKDINKKRNSLLLFLKNKGIPLNEAYKMINELHF